jgi:hypothetical protein
MFDESNKSFTSHLQEISHYLFMPIRAKTAHPWPQPVLWPKGTQRAGCQRKNQERCPMAEEQLHEKWK